jgi:putative phage-type endonuclease
MKEEFLTRRRKGIGGSDVGAIFGYSKWSTPLDIYNSKLGIDKPKKDYNDVCHAGNFFEDGIAKFYAFKKKIPLEQVKIHEGQPIVNEKYPWLLANPDRLIVSDNITYGLECKNVDISKSDQWKVQEGNEDLTDRIIPIEYLYQIATYRMVLDCPFYDIAAVIGGNDIRIYRYFKNETLENEIEKKTKHFWYEYVEKQVPPPCVTYEDAFKKYSVPVKNSVNSNDEINNKIKQLIDCKSLMQKLEKEEEKLKIEICEHMKGMEELHYKDTKLVSWLSGTRSGLNIAKLKEEAPEIYDKYVTVNNFRILRISPKAKDLLCGIIFTYLGFPIKGILDNLTGSIHENFYIFEFLYGLY